ncbi:MAG: sulfurtransferase [Pirellulales bacterium]
MESLRQAYAQPRARLADDRFERPLAMWMAAGVVLITLVACSSEPAESTTSPSTASDVELAAKAETTPPEVTPTSYRAPRRLLIDVDTLKEQLDNPRLKILDTRRADEYLAAHIVGAVHVDVDQWIENSRREGGLEDAAFWSDLVGSFGISRDSQVVICGETVPNAARVWWTLRYLGVDDVRLLDGSWRQWGRKFYPMESKSPEIAPAAFQPAFQKPMLMTREALKGALGSHDDRMILIDARSRGEYKGQDAAGQRAGHIPGAVNLEWKEVLDEGNHFLTPERLQQQFRKLGVERVKTVVPYCRSGARSSVMTFALSLAGYPTVRHYYGGWLDWSADEEAPVEGKTP